MDAAARCGVCWNELCRRGFGRRNDFRDYSCVGRRNDFRRRCSIGRTNSAIPAQDTALLRGHGQAGDHRDACKEHHHVGASHCRQSYLFRTRHPQQPNTKVPKEGFAARALLCRTTLISVPITACAQLSFPRSYLFIDLRAVYAHIANCECSTALRHAHARRTVRLTTSSRTYARPQNRPLSLWSCLHCESPRAGGGRFQRSKK